MSCYRKKVYDSHNGDSGLNVRTGQVVEVLRELTDREADIADVGRMFHVRFADGFETDVFEDELEVHDTVKIIVDGTNTFQVVDSVPLGYVIWNIGNNMADGYLPLCQVGGPDGCQVNPDTLKAVKCDGAQTILDAATCAVRPAQCGGSSASTRTRSREATMTVACSALRPRFRIWTSSVGPKKNRPLSAK